MFLSIAAAIDLTPFSLIGLFERLSVTKIFVKNESIREIIIERMVLTFFSTNTLARASIPSSSRWV